MEKNTTAVQWLIEKFNIYLPSIHQKGLEEKFKQALAMEKDQIEDAFCAGQESTYMETIGECTDKENCNKRCLLIKAVTSISPGFEEGVSAADVNYYNETYKP